MNRNFKNWMYPGLIILLSVLIQIISEDLVCSQAVYMMNKIQPENMQFREMKFSPLTIVQLKELNELTKMETGEILAVIYPETAGDFLRFPVELSKEAILRRKELYIEKCREAYICVSKLYGAIWNDIAAFPVSADAEAVYENTWMFERTYGGIRGHEGTDLMPACNIPGHYRIYSMTDGIIEKIGWLPQGGYRIGIRSPSGAYFYYAHLDSYETAFQTGDAVYAGQTLGYMGDTGYGEEGTMGKFPVHLHLGIYIQTSVSEELSINPYWILRYIESKSSE